MGLCAREVDSSELRAACPVAQQPWTCWELQTHVPVRVECECTNKAPTLSRAHSRSSLNVGTPPFFLESWKRSKELWPLGILQEFIWGDLEFGAGGGNGTQRCLSSKALSSPVHTAPYSLLIDLHVLSTISSRSPVAAANPSHTPNLWMRKLRLREVKGPA